MRLSDPATGEILEVDIDDATRDRYEKAAAEHSATVSEALRSARARVIDLRTDRDWVADIARFVLAYRRVASMLHAPPTGVSK